MSALRLRAATPADADAIWAILEPILRAGEPFALPADWSREEALGYWLQPAHRAFVAERNGRLLGAYYLRPNQLGPGDHVANGSYATHPDARGQGVARAMGLHSFEAARQAGFTALQFNLVLATNAAAIGLWRSLGMNAVGRLPQVFRHPRLGLVDALVMHRPL